MSYKQAMKWSRKHPKGIKQSYMGFNPGGHTAENLRDRETKYIAELEAMTAEARQAIRNNIKAMEEVWKGSYPWEWCVFIRRYGLKD